MRHMLVGMHVCVAGSHVPEQHSDETEQLELFMRHASGAHCAAMLCTAGFCPGSQYGTCDGSPVPFALTAVTQICRRVVPRVPACALP